jgi:hypothetical protein
MQPEDLPAYSDLILPVIKAVEKLGGSAQAAEIVEQVLSDLDPSDEVLALTPLGRELLWLPDEEGQRRVRELDREFRQTAHSASEPPADCPARSAGNRGGGRHR